MVERAKVPERTLKRRFQVATNTSLIEHLQNLWIEEAKRLLESSTLPVDEISAAVSFRRRFKRCTGLTPSQYRRMFQPILKATGNGPQ
ncbi:hypothetical protein TMS3_0116920 [Pseudomonas taeanensis MS-3]|uniref:HTH araC/xylS-type domain-containing protein n=1 Tax=Pseudomonas taeanensis MS-3 TaxID=1395571 RepID=A0A0A1YKE7_9PSED|nr:helix-turn-helix domain-containing protein [Pseudomonas taeanensis]KFX69149.1 hypothetical protein TMS3_0116920 [Pseudomonas taeanensis MS-3]